MYQQERRTAFADEISKERISITSQINSIRNQWGVWFEAFVPLNFETEYKKMYKNQSSVYIWDQALLAIDFDELGDPGFESNVIKAIKACDPKFIERENWGYPLRLFFISKLVNILSRTGNWEPTKPKNIFPVSAVELGYKEWEEDFKDIYKMKDIIERLIRGDEKSDLIQGLKSYFSSRLDTAYVKRYIGGVIESIHNFLTALDQVNKSIKKIEEKTYILNQNYANKISSNWLFLFTLTGLIFGVIIPLISINLNVNISSIVGNGIFSIAIISIIISFFIFFQNATSSKKITDQEYLIEFRYEPLAKVLTNHSQFIAEYDKVDISFLYDLVNHTEKEDIPKERIKKISTYLNLAEEYNSITEYFWEQIQIRLMGKFSFVKSPPFNTGYSTVSNSIWFDKEKRDSRFKNAIKNKNTLGFNAKSSIWTRDLVYIPFNHYTGTLDDFIDKVDAIATQITDSLKEKNYFNIRESLKKENTDLIKVVSYEWANGR